MSVNDENRKSFWKKSIRNSNQGKKISQKKIKELESATTTAKENLKSISIGKILSEAEYHNCKRFSGVFEAGSGAEAIRKFLKILIKKKRIKLKKKWKGLRIVSVLRNVLKVKLFVFL